MPEMLLEQKVEKSSSKSLKLDPAFQIEINRLRKSDNVTNWFYIAREYLWLAMALGLPLAFLHYRESWGLNFWWNVPVALLAITVIGACQHRIVNLGHEGGHYALFKNRWLNETAANYFALFPVLGTAHIYRLQHLAHHQHLNHPELDPDMVYMNYLGQSFFYRMPFKRFLWVCVFRHVVWFPNLLRYILDRAKFANLGGISDPYRIIRSTAKPLATCMAAYYGSLAAVLIYGVSTENMTLLWAAPLVWFATIAVVLHRVPDTWFAKTQLKCVLSPRTNNTQRASFLTSVFAFLAIMTLATGHPWVFYYFLLWLVPLGTSFSLYMILREDIQHSNTGDGKLEHSRDFRGNPLIRWSVFPMGQAYHLAHHLYPMVPHYNLHKVDELLRQTEIYKREAVVVDRFRFPQKLSAAS
ncbi:MAG: fatty acid desaturase [Planctomycetota bacterium]